VAASPGGPGAPLLLRPAPGPPGDGAQSGGGGGCGCADRRRGGA